MSFVNEIDDVVYILTVLSFFIFIGCYYLFIGIYHYHFIIITIVRFYYIILYYTLYCKYTIQLSSCKLFTNKLAIYLHNPPFVVIKYDSLLLLLLLLF